MCGNGFKCEFPGTLFDANGVLQFLHISFANPALALITYLNRNENRRIQNELKLPQPELSAGMSET